MPNAMRLTRNSVTAFLAVASISIAVPAFAAPFTIYNTGVDDVNAVIPLGSVDSHWTLDGGSAFAPLAIPGVWIPEDDVSLWLTPTAAGDDAPPGTYNYSTTFSLDGLVPSTAALAGRFTSDNNTVNFLLNGAPLGISNGENDFGIWTNFLINNGFVAGTNTLTVQVQNSADDPPNPTGVRVEFTSATAASVAPEPSALALTLPALALAGIVLRRRKAADK